MFWWGDSMPLLGPRQGKPARFCPGFSAAAMKAPNMAGQGMTRPLGVRRTVFSWSSSTKVSARSDGELFCTSSYTLAHLWQWV